MRCILVILDGIGDRSHPILEHNTPLYSAYTPNLDYLASIGLNGLYHTYKQGVAMPSEIAHFLMMGYSLKEFPGRGYLEAIGEGIEIKEKQVGIIARLVSVKLHENKFLLLNRNPKVKQEYIPKIVNEIKYFEYKNIKIEFIPTKGLRGFLKISGSVSPHITDSDPFYENRYIIDICPTDSSTQAKSTSACIREYLKWSFNKLNNHEINIELRQKNGMYPVNMVITQRAGQKKSLMNFRQKWGLKGLSISSQAIYWGLFKELGFDIVKTKDTKDPEADLAQRLKIAIQSKEYSFIHVHTKMPDKAGHLKDPVYKKDIISCLDRAIKVIKDEIILDPELLVVITGDHSTASSGRMIHTGESVPITMVGQYIRRDLVTAFNEIDCAKGGLGMVKGDELMYLILNFMDMGKLKGLMDTPEDQPYYPGFYTPLSM
ncbi:MAG: alkaline phosphatase family protein [Desulfonauticus sp.]|nr:alkaline phosphatase family protein [Desulfonauticus sp.]